MFHVELRQSIHQARKFNMTREQLDAQIMRPWLAGEVIWVDEHEYIPKRAKLIVVEARELAISEMGMGRGWQVVNKEGEEVTDRVMSETRAGSGAASGATSAQSGTPAAGDAIAEFKATLLGACSLEPRALGDVVKLAGVRHPGARASAQLELAERAVWELLHQQKLALYLDDDGTPVPPEEWEALVLAWGSWSGGADIAVRAL